jgi:acyl carrier protein
MTELIVFLESTFAIKVPDTALFSPEFTSIEGIASLVEQVQADARASVNAKGQGGG